MSQIQDVKAASDIVSIIGERVTLVPSGTYLKGLCPFHSEKTPSFFVSPTLQRYKCYGCQEGGDVLSFIQKYEHVTFYEALKMLAEKVGITLSHDVQTKEDRDRAELLTIVGLARDYYHFILSKHQAGKAAREYLQNRQITQKSITIFQLGYALNSWDGLLTYLHKKKRYPLEQLQKAGLVVKGQYGRYYDRFRDRIMFPLKDTHGTVVGFSGRSISATATEAKYINTPETVLYHKSKLLFGYAELKREIQKKRQVIVVEGEFDVLSSAQASVNHVVAIKGSALTPDHAQLLTRVADQVLLALDTDTAGIEATKKSIRILKPYDTELRVICLGKGKDPDELARKNPSAWRQVVKQSVSAHEFLIDTAVSQTDVSSPRGKRSVIKQLASLLWSIESQVERELYLQKLAAALQTDVELVKADIQLFAKTPAAPIAPTPSIAVAQTVSRLDKLETYVLFLLLRGKEELLLTNVKQLQSLPLLPNHLKQLVSFLPKDNEHITWQSYLLQLPADLSQFVMDTIANPQLSEVFPIDNWDKEWQKALSDLQQEMKRVRREKIATELESLAQADLNDPKTQKKQTDLLAELSRL